MAWFPESLVKKLDGLFRRERPRIPALLWQSCVERLPFLQRLSAAELERLRALAETLLARQTVTGAGGLEITDEMAVLIVTQAALLVLNLTPDLYDDMAGIIVYPSAFIVPQSEMDDAGVVHEWREPLAGEAVRAGGAVILSWEDADDAAWHDAGQNLVIHEFAHKIDMGRGEANGCPPFLSRFHAGMDVQEWQAEFSAAYANFTARVDLVYRQLPEDFNPDHEGHAARYDELAADLPIDPYAASHPAEFFAVASEAFFVHPAPLAEDYPSVYRLLERYYRQTPLGVTAGPP